MDGLKQTFVPDAKLLLVGAAAVAVLLAGLALWRARRGRGPMVVQTRATPKMKGSLDASARGRSVNVALGREILPLLEEGRTDEAVALVRGRTGWGDAEARASVAKLERLMKRLGME